MIRFFARLTGFLRRSPTGAFESEMETHRGLLEEDLRRRGLTPSEARNAANREMGNVTALREQYREQAGFPWLESLMQDTRYAYRTLRRAPGFAGACIGVLAVGLGGMIAMLCVLIALLFRPLPYPDAKALVFLNEVDPRAAQWPLSEPMLLDVATQSRSLEAVGGFRRSTVALTGSGEAQAVHAAEVTSGFFPALRMTAVVGRFPAQSDSTHVVIGRELWRKRWARDPRVVGRAIRIEGSPYVISAVADLPQDILPGAEILLPIVLQPTGSYSAHDLDVVARLRPGVAVSQASAELGILSAAIGRRQPRTNAGWALQATPLFDYITGPDTVRALWTLLAAVGFVWILACANVAGMLMARGATRSHEIGTRFALGASRGRVFRQMLTESVLLSVVGAAVGLLIAGFAVSLIGQYGPAILPRLAGVHMDALTVCAALGVMILSTLLFGTSPAWSAARAGLRFTSLRSGRGVSKNQTGRDALVVVQVALASVLLLGSVLLFQSFVRLRAVDPGFQSEGLLTVQLNLSGARYDAEHRVRFIGGLTRKLQSLVSVAGVAATSVDPFTGENTANRFRLEGEGDSAQYRVAGWRSVTPGFFRTMEIPLKRGRLFDDRDADGATEVVIVSDSMAQRFWPGQDPVGRDLLWGKSGNPKRIVGIVGDMRDVELQAEPAPMMYRPYPQLTAPAMTLVIRTHTNGLAASSEVRNVIAAADPELPVNVHSLPQSLADSMQRPRTGLLSVATFALTALLIAGFGLFGVVSYRVSQRRQEIGIRLALGASPNDVRWSVQQRSVNLVVAGLAIGIPVGFLCSKFLASLLFQTETANAVPYLLVSAAFIAIAFLASYAPARRAARTDPVETLRYE